MALDNLNCPQFVDFTNTSIFGFDDGADIYFENRVVGELGFNDQNRDNGDIDDASDNKKDSGISECLNTSPQNGNKENNNLKTSASSTTLNGSVNNNNSNQQNKSTKSKYTKHNSSKQQQQQQNIVKKTIGKVTAAFNSTTSKQQTNDLKLKTKQQTTNSQNKSENHGPLMIRVATQQHHQTSSSSNDPQQMVSLEITQTSKSTSRCSSVPRTLEEKLAITTQIDDPLIHEYSDTIKKTTIDLNDIWDRIGYNNETISRYQSFYKELIKIYQRMLESEKYLEKEILDKINEHRKLMCRLTHELDIKYDEDYAKVYTLLDQEKLLSDKVKQLDKLKDERKSQMKKYKDEIMKFFHDLDMSQQSDSFSKLIITKEIDELTLSESDLQRAKDVLDELRKRDEKLSEKIKSTKYKIRKLWSKLSIENENLIELINNESSNQSNSRSISKSQIINMLDEELERCLKLEIANNESEKELFGDETFNEELREIHKEKLEDLKFKYAECLDEKTAKLIELSEQFKVFGEKTKDPNRFKMRGYNALEEEKERRQFKTQIKKLEEEIYEYAEEYKRTNGGQAYQICGIDWNQYISQLKNDCGEYKRNEKKEKRDNKKVQQQKYKCKTPLKRLNRTKIKVDAPNLIRSKKLQRTGNTVISKQTAKTSKLKNTSKINIKTSTPMKQLLRQTTATSNTTTTTVSSNASSEDYPFKYINTNDINYMEFTRHLPKPLRFDGTTNSNKYHNDRRKKLTSTFINE